MISITGTEFDIDGSQSTISVNMSSTSGAFTAYKDITDPVVIIMTGMFGFVLYAIKVPWEDLMGTLSTDLFVQQPKLIDEMCEKEGNREDKKIY